MNGESAEIKGNRMHAGTVGFDEVNRQARLIWLLIRPVLR